MLNTNIPLRDSVQRVKIAIAPSDNNYIYAATVDTLGGLFGIYKSTNAGVSWQKVYNSSNVLEGGQGTSQGAQGNYDLGFSVDPANKDYVYIGGVNLWGSNDGAQTFSPIAQWMTSNGPTIHGDIHFIDAQPLTGNYFVCSDGGIYRTTNLVLSNWGTHSFKHVNTKIETRVKKYVIAFAVFTILPSIYLAYRFVKQEIFTQNALVFINKEIKEQSIFIIDKT